MKLRIVATALAAAASAGCSAAPSATSGDESSSPPATEQAWVPTGELVYATLPSDRSPDDFVLPVLHTINADGSGGRTLALSAMGAVWSDDGAHLLVNGVPVTSSDFWPWRPAVVDPDGEVRKLFRLPGLPGEINNCHWAPDHHDLVCDGDLGMVRIDPATSQTTRLAREGTNEVWDVSADGRIVFAHQVSGSDGREDAELWTIDIDGSGRHKLTEFGEVEGTYDTSGGSWLPDGSAIVTATPGGRLVKVDATTGELAEIPLDQALFASRPAVSPDGTMIAFEAVGDHQDIYATPIDGGPVVLVTGTDDDEIRPEWRPSTSAFE